MKSKLAMVSLLSLTVLYGILGALLILIAYLTGFGADTGILLAIGVVIIQFLINPWLTDLCMRWFYKAKFDQPVPEYLQEFIQKVCDENNMQYPKIGYIDDGAPNAFTYGHTKNNARVVLTRGIYELLDEEEIKNVVAHELGHAAHYDMLFMTVAQLVPLILYYIYEFCMKVKTSGKDSSKAEAAIKAVGLIAYILYIICQYIILWLSRTREYYADDFAARATGNPNAMATALVRIGLGLGSRTNKETTKSVKSLGIADEKNSKAMAVCCASSDGELHPEKVKNAMKWDLWNVWAFFYELESTHPLTAKRIIAIEKLAPEFGQEATINFDLEKPESYLDDFLKELAIAWAPALCIIAGVIALIVKLAVNKVFDPSVLLYFVAGFGLSIFKHYYSHRTNFEETKVEDLLGEVKVSRITSVPCVLSGKLIGRGNPGNIFNEDFVINDGTGIMFLDYNQPLKILEKIFAFFQSESLLDQNATVVGWYRRGPVPYVQLKSITVGEKTKKCATVTWGYILRGVLLAAAIIGFIALL